MAAALDGEPEKRLFRTAAMAQRGTFPDRPLWLQAAEGVGCRGRGPRSAISARARGRSAAKIAELSKRMWKTFDETR